MAYPKARRCGLADRHCWVSMCAGHGERVDLTVVWGGFLRYLEQVCFRKHPDNRWNMGRVGEGVFPPKAALGHSKWEEAPVAVTCCRCGPGIVKLPPSLVTEVLAVEGSSSEGTGASQVGIAEEVSWS